MHLECVRTRRPVVGRAAAVGKRRVVAQEVLRILAHVPGAPRLLLACVFGRRGYRHRRGRTCMRTSARLRLREEAVRRMVGVPFRGLGYIEHAIATRDPAAGPPAVACPEHGQRAVLVIVLMLRRNGQRVAADHAHCTGGGARVWRASKRACLSYASSGMQHLLARSGSTAGRGLLWRRWGRKRKAQKYTRPLDRSLRVRPCASHIVFFPRVRLHGKELPPRVAIGCGQSCSAHLFLVFSRPNKNLVWRARSGI